LVRSKKGERPLSLWNADPNKTDDSGIMTIDHCLAALPALVRPAAKDLCSKQPTTRTRRKSE
jgi:hypothetical protein